MLARGRATGLARDWRGRAVGHHDLARRWGRNGTV